MNSKTTGANTFLKSCRCPICSATVLVRKHGNLKASLLKALALAEHVKTLHPSIVR